MGFVGKLKISEDLRLCATFLVSELGAWNFKDRTTGPQTYVPEAFQVRACI